MEIVTRKPQDGLEKRNNWITQMAEYKQKIEHLDSGADEDFLAIGDILIQARETYKGHGNWIKWIDENLPFSPRQAQRRIKAATFEKKTRPWCRT